MHKQTLYQLKAELKEVIRLERAMKYCLLTPNDVISLRALAIKGIPRAELLYALYLIAVERSDAEGYHLLQRCQRHCNEIYLRKIAYIDKMLLERGTYGI
jgi:hypothetical protein